MGGFKDLTGQRFGYLTAIRRLGMKDGKTNWQCRCECGTITEATIDVLRNGRKKSCGCYRARPSDYLPPVIQTCAKCGEEFENKNRANARKLCDVCRAKNKKENEIAQRERLKEQRQKAQEKAREPMPKLRIETVDRLAKERKMTYGKFAAAVQKAGEIPGEVDERALTKLPPEMDADRLWRINHPDTRKCRSCVFRMYIGGGQTDGVSAYGCQYILMTGKKRPCAVGKDCTAYIKRGRRRHDME